MRVGRLGLLIKNCSDFSAKAPDAGVNTPSDWVVLLKALLSKMVGKLEMALSIEAIEDNIVAH